mgnify:CR=1 FL=1
MKYYKPELRKPDDLPIPKEEIETSPLARVLGSGKTIKTSLDIDVAIDRFADGIYSGYKSGLRELYNNEARACRQSRDEFNANPEIHITLDPTERSFTIEGKDSLGIGNDLPEYVALAIKIVMQGTNSALPPMIKDFRAIAFQA